MFRMVQAWLIAASCLLALTAVGTRPVRAQKGETPTVCVGFRNDTKNAVVVQGAVTVKGMKRLGAPILVPVNKVSFENNVPTGPRLITIYDANQPNRKLLTDEPITLVPGGDLNLI